MHRPNGPAPTIRRLTSSIQAPRKRLCPSGDHLDGYTHRFAAAEAEAGDATPQAAVPQGIQESCQDTSARRAEGMAEGDRASVHVDLIPVPARAVQRIPVG